MPISTKKVLRRLIPAVFYTLLVIFLALYLKGLDWSKLHSAQPHWGYLGIAAITGLIERYWQIVIWLVLLQSLGARGLRHHGRQLVYVYAKSWLGRYIPGSAPWILGKIYFASQHGIAKEKLGVSSLLEGIVQIMVMLSLSFLMLLGDHRFVVVSPAAKLFMAAAAVGCIAFLVPPIFNFFISKAFKLLRRRTLDTEHLVNGAAVVKGTVLYAIAALLNGLSFFLVAKSLYPPLPYHDLIFVTAASNLASAVGMLAIFAPSGIGVREGVQLVLLTTVMPKEIALLVVVVSRLWSVALDFIFFAAGWLIGHATPSPG